MCAYIVHFFVCDCAWRIYIYEYLLILFICVSMCFIILLYVCLCVYVLLSTFVCLCALIYERGV